MPSYSGTMTSSQGTRTLDITTRDAITFTPTSGTYTVEYPLGTLAVNASSSAQTITSNGSATQLRVTCLTGSLAFSNVDNADSLPLSANPYVLFQSAIPFILAGGTATNQFTISATGALSNLPTLPITSGFAFIYLPAITGLTAGWYYAQILSATTAQISTSRYTSGDPKLAVPDTFTNPAGITAGNYSQLLTQIVAHQYTLPGGSMGPSGSVTSRVVLLYTAVGSSISYNLNFGGSNWASQTPGVSTNAIFNFATTAFNAGTASRQFSNNFWSDTSGATNVAPNFMSINTAADVVIQNYLTLNNAASVAIINNLRYELFYGA